MPTFSYDVLHADDHRDLCEKLNLSGEKGFALKQVVFTDKGHWVAVLQKPGEGVAEEKP